MKIGIRESRPNIAPVLNWLNLKERNITMAKNKIVAIEESHIKANISGKIKERPKVLGINDRPAPIKVAIPLPPANLKKKDQLWPATAATPDKTWISGENPKT